MPTIKAPGLTVNTTIEATQYELDYSCSGKWDWEESCTGCFQYVSRSMLKPIGDADPETSRVCKDCADDLDLKPSRYGTRWVTK